MIKHIKSITAFTLIELLVVISIIAILGALVVGSGSGCSRSSGTRVGIVTKFSHKGIINKTHEGKLLMGGGSSSPSGVIASTWAFTVRKSEVATKVREALNSGKPVALDYDQSLFVAPWTADTSYNVTGVRDITDVKNVTNGQPAVQHEEQ